MGGKDITARRGSHNLFSIWGEALRELMEPRQYTFKSWMGWGSESLTRGVFWKRQFSLSRRIGRGICVCPISIPRNLLRQQNIIQDGEREREF